VQTTPRLSNRWSAWWDWLVDDEQLSQPSIARRNSQLLRSLLLTLVPFGIIITLAQLWLTPENSSVDLDKTLFTDPDTLALFGGVACWGVAYWAITRGYYKAASFLAIVTAIVAIFIGVSTDGDLGDLPQLVLPLLIAAMLFPLRTTLVTICATLLGLLLLPLLNTQIQATHLVTRPFTFCFLCMILIYIAFHHRNQIERERQAELAENEARYRGLFNATFEGFAIHGQGKIADCNAGLAAMLGYDPRELRGRPLLQLFAEEARPAVLLHLDNSAAQPLEAAGLMKNGDTLHLEIINHRQATPTNTTHILAMRDITQRKVAEETLRSAQKFDSLGMLAGGVAHDFNNLLQTMMGQVALAGALLPADTPAHRYLDQAVKSAQHAASLTRQLLAYAGRDIAEHALVNLNQLIQESASLLEPLLSRHDWLHLQLAADTPLLSASQTQLRQVLSNLVINAAEAIDRDTGVVTIQTRSVVVNDRFDSQHFLGHLPLRTGHYLCLEVADNGHGLDEATAQRIFDPFFTTKPSGHGLGLSTTFGIIRSHRGVIRLISAPGRGATFTILFPAQADSDKETRG
jgi:PAS domain S-box-containing protein